MVRGRRFRHAYLLGSLLLLAASLHSTTAYSAPGDPPSGSPAGSVYQLPLEQGRADAAPKGGGGTGVPGEGGAGGDGGGGGSEGGSGAAPGASESGSLYRSENNFGSSSHVPGTASANGTSQGAGGGGAQGAGSDGAGKAAVVGGTIAADSADNGNTSIPAGVALLAGIALLAVGVGLLSRRAGRG